MFYSHYYHFNLCEGDDYYIPIKKITLLQLAIEKENNNIVQLLLETKKVNVNEIGYIYNSSEFETFQEKITQTALHIAVEQDYLDIVKLLLSYDGIDVNFVSICKQKIEKRINHEITIENLAIIEQLLKYKNIDIDKKLSVTLDVYCPIKQIKKEEIKALDIAIKRRNTQIINLFKNKTALKE